MGKRQDQTPGEQQQCPRSQGHMGGRGLSQPPRAGHLPGGAALYSHCGALSAPSSPMRPPNPAPRPRPCSLAPDRSDLSAQPWSKGVWHRDTLGFQHHHGSQPAQGEPALRGPAPPDALRASSGGLDLQVSEGIRPLRAPRPIDDAPLSPDPRLYQEIRERGQDPKWATDTEKEVLGPEANLERTCHFAFSSLSPIGY